MAVIINKGWLWLTNGTDTLKLAAEQIFWDENRSPIINHFVGALSTGYDLTEEHYVFTVKRIYFDSETDYKNFKIYINAWQTTAPFTLKIQNKSTGEFKYPDGVHTEYSVLYNGMKKCYDAVAGDEEFYVVENMQFEEAGSRA